MVILSPLPQYPNIPPYTRENVAVRPIPPNPSKCGLAPHTPPPPLIPVNVDLHPHPTLHPRIPTQEPRARTRDQRLLGPGPLGPGPGPWGWIQPNTRK